MGEKRNRTKLVLTLDLLRQAVRYERESGNFYWLNDRRSGAKADSLAGGINGRGYRTIGLFGRFYYAHRLAWLLENGEWPLLGIDHIDGDCGNNRISNLRPCDQSENRANSKKQSRNSSGAKGVFWIKSTKRWKVQIKCKGQLFFVGNFTDKDAAISAYFEKAKELFGEFARAA